MNLVTDEEEEGAQEPGPSKRTRPAHSADAESTTLAAPTFLAPPKGKPPQQRKARAKLKLVAASQSPTEGMDVDVDVDLDGVDRGRQVQSQPLPGSRQPHGRHASGSGAARGKAEERLKRQVEQLQSLVERVRGSENSERAYY